MRSLVVPTARRLPRTATPSDFLSNIDGGVKRSLIMPPPPPVLESWQERAAYFVVFVSLDTVMWLDGVRLECVVKAHPAASVELCRARVGVELSLLNPPPAILAVVRCFTMNW